MAKSGNKSVVVTPVASYLTLRFSWSETSQSITNNSTKISWTLELIANSYGALNSTTQKRWSVTINGATWSGTTTVGIANNATKTLAFGTADIPHNADGTKTFAYSFTQSFTGITFSNTALGDVTGSSTGTLDRIPREATITSAPDFSDGENPTITYSNPAGSAVTALQACISLVNGTGGDDIPYRDIPTTGTAYTFNLTAAERQTLSKAVKTGTSTAVRFYIATNIGGTIYRSYVTKTFTINDASPVISAVSALDTSEQTKALTGNANYWIKGFSDIRYTIMASARKDASISSYEATCGDITQYGSTGTLINIADSSINVKVTDNRGNTATSVVTPNRWINYNGLTCTGTKAKLDINGVLTFTVTGVYFTGSFGATSNNIDAGYRYRLVSNPTFSNWVSVPVVVSENSYSVTDVIAGLDYREDYVIQFYAQDKLQRVESPQYLVHMSTPIFEWDKDDFIFNVHTTAPSLLLSSPSGIHSLYPDKELRSIMNVGQNTGTLMIGSGGKANGYSTYVGGDTVLLEANESVSLDGKNILLSSDTFVNIDAPSGLYVNNVPISGGGGSGASADYIVDQGTSSDGYWVYRKWNSGIAELWGYCQASYQQAYYLSGYTTFPITLKSWTSAIGTINGFSGNLARYLAANVKVECFTYGCNVWVQNSTSGFQSNDLTGVSLHIVGTWK